MSPVDMAEAREGEVDRGGGLERFKAKILKKDRTTTTMRFSTAPHLPPTLQHRPNMSANHTRVQSHLYRTHDAPFVGLISTDITLHAAHRVACAIFMLPLRDT